MRGVRRLGFGALGLAVTLVFLIGLAAPAAALAVARPVVTSVSPASGSNLGGTTVTIHGKHFTVDGRSVVKKVLFGATAATNVKVKSAVTLTVRAPRGTGTVNVRVVTKGGTSAAVKADRFVFKGALPVVTGLSPAYGPTTGGTVVTITGSGFTGATSVTVGGVAATKLTVAAGGGTITATTPAHTEVGDPFHVRVTTPTGASAPVNADRFYFYAPATVTSVSPANGPRAGGTTVTITGTNLSTAKNISQAVKFGGVPATVVGQPTNSTIVATVPPAAAGTGTVDVTVTTRAGTTAASTGDEFSYADTIAVAPAGLQDQSQVVGVAVGTPPSVVVKDALGQPVKGVTVTFAVTTGGGTVTSATATTPTTTATAITDVSGVATLRSWALGPLAGANALTATADVPGLPVTFTATGLADVNTAYMAAVPGSDGQSATAGAAVAISPSVRVLDSGGNGVPNVSVTFTVTSGGGSATGTTVSTNASGIATVGKWVLGPAVGANTLQAAASVTGSPVTFTVNGKVGAATQILAVSDTDQSGIAGGQAPIPPSVVVEDANNNPVPGVSVTFAVDSGGGTVGGSPAVTNSSGIATVGSWKLGPGANKLTATAAGVSGSVAFTASAALIVTGADTVADLHIANGTSLGAAEAALPATVGISLSDGTSATANVTWTEGSPSYDGDTAGSYPFVGTLSGLSGRGQQPERRHRRGHGRRGRADRDERRRHRRRIGRQRYLAGCGQGRAAGHGRGDSEQRRLGDRRRHLGPGLAALQRRHGRLVPVHRHAERPARRRDQPLGRHRRGERRRGCADRYRGSQHRGRRGR